MFRFARQAIVSGATLAIFCGPAAGQDRPPRIASIEIRGNKAINNESIVATSGLKVGDSASADALAAAKNNLVASGNFGIRHPDKPDDAVKVSMAEIDPKANQGKLVIEVDENEVVKGFNITGTGPVPPKEVLAQLQTRHGYVLNTKTLSGDIDRVTKLYDSKGYIATIDASGFNMHDGILHIPIVVGRIGSIDLLGITPAEREKYRRLLEQMKVKPGDYYNVNDFRRVYEKIFKTKLFEDIQPAILTPKPGVVSLAISFTKK